MRVLPTPIKSPFYPVTHVRYFGAQALCYPKPRGSKVARKIRWSRTGLVCSGRGTGSHHALCCKPNVGIFNLHNSHSDYMKLPCTIFSDRIQDQETERWITLLISRDERVRNNMTEEELRDVHARLTGKVMESKGDVMKQSVVVEQYVEQTQHQSMQATSMCIHKMNNYILCCCTK